MEVSRRFTREETYEIEEDALSSLLNEQGALDNPGHHLGLEIDLARALRHEMDTRLHGSSL